MDFLLRKRGMVEDIIRECGIKTSPNKTFTEGLLYAYEDGGKRIRPLLMLESYQLFNEEITDSLKFFMTAVELVHAFSLVHDDLPEMDNDEMRRGKESTFKKYGHGMGLLIGDALLNYAYELIAKSFEKDNIDISKKISAFNIFSHYVGKDGMIGGQVLDTMDGEKTEFMLNEIIEKKTGALISLSIEVGAILSNANRRECEVLSSIGKKIGYIFQMRDDILDEDGYVLFHTKKEVQTMIEKLSNEAISELKSLNKDTAFFEKLVTYLSLRTE